MKPTTERTYSMITPLDDATMHRLFVDGLVADLVTLTPDERRSVIKRAYTAVGMAAAAVDASIDALARDVFTPSTHDLDCACGECLAALDAETGARR